MSEPTAARPASATGAGTTRAIVAACALVAAALDGLQLARPGYLLGGTADIGVYFGTAVRLAHGVLPYRDFVLVQPPGIALLLSPFGLLSELTGTRYALAAVRLATILVAAANVLLVGRLVRHRGPLLTLVACGVMAIYPAELYALNAGLLEPISALLCLLGASLVFDRGRWSGSRRRWLLGGAVMGLAVDVKLPGILPALALAAICLPDPRRRMLPLAAGGVAGIALPCLAFFAAAPGPFVRDVVLSQLGRIPSAARAPISDRLAGMTVPGAGTVAVVATLLVLAVIVAGLAVRGRRPDPVEWFAVAAGILVAASQFAPAEYYAQYPAFLAPFLAIALGTAADRVVSLARRPRPGMVVVAAIAAALLGIEVAAVETTSTHDPGPAVDAVVPAGACTLSNGPRLLVPSDRLVSSSPGCTEMVDPFGTRLSYSGDPAQGVAALRAALAHADYLTVSSGVTGWLNGPYATLRGYVASDFGLVRSGAGVWIYVRHGYPVA